MTCLSIGEEPIKVGAELAGIRVPARVDVLVQGTQVYRILHLLMVLRASVYIPQVYWILHPLMVLGASMYSQQVYWILHLLMVLLMAL